MSYDGRNIYKIRREQAGYTQEHAAELLGCSVRALARYESGEVLPSDYIARRMDDLYNNHFLSYEHLRQSSQVAAELLPPVEDHGFPAAVIEFISLCLSGEIDEAGRELLRLAEDGRLDPEEKEKFESKVLPVLGRITRAATEVRLAAGNDIGQAEKGT